MNLPETPAVYKLIELNVELQQLNADLRIPQTGRGKGVQETMNLLGLQSSIRTKEGEIRAVNELAVLEFELLANRTKGADWPIIRYTVGGKNYIAELFGNNKIIMKM